MSFPSGQCRCQNRQCAVLCEQSLDGCRNRATLGAAGESFGSHAHNLPHLFRTRGPDFGYDGAKFGVELLGRELLRKILLEHCRFGKLVVGKLRPPVLLIILALSFRCFTIFMMIFVAVSSLSSPLAPFAVLASKNSFLAPLRASRRTFSRASIAFLMSSLTLSNRSISLSFSPGQTGADAPLSRSISCFNPQK